MSYQGNKSWMVNEERMKIIVEWNSVFLTAIFLSFKRLTISNFEIPLQASKREIFFLESTKKWVPTKWCLSKKHHKNKKTFFRLWKSLQNAFLTTIQKLKQLEQFWWARLYYLMSNELFKITYFEFHFPFFSEWILPAEKIRNSLWRCPTSGLCSQRLSRYYQQPILSDRTCIQQKRCKSQSFLRRNL